MNTREAVLAKNGSSLKEATDVLVLLGTSLLRVPYKHLFV